MSPFEHGEVFVLDDGGEVRAGRSRDRLRVCAQVLGQQSKHAAGWLQADLDLGNYERFMDITLTKDNNLTTGKIYSVGVNLHASQPSCAAVHTRHMLLSVSTCTPAAVMCSKLGCTH